MKKEQIIHIENLLKSKQFQFEKDSFRKSYHKLLALRYLNEFVLVFLLQIIGLHLSPAFNTAHFPIYLGLNLVLLFWRGIHCVVPMALGSLTFFYCSDLMNVTTLSYALGSAFTLGFIHQWSLKLFGPIVPLKSIKEWLGYVFLLSSFLTLFFIFLFPGHKPTLVFHYLLFTINGSLIISSAFFVWGAYPIYHFPKLPKLQTALGLSLLITANFLFYLYYQQGYAYWFAMLFLCFTLGLFINKHGRFGLCFALFSSVMIFNALQSVLATPHETLIYDQLILYVVIVTFMALAILKDDLVRIR